MTEKTKADYLGMSDEEFMQVNSPEVEEPADKPETKPEIKEGESTPPIPTEPEAQADELETSKDGGAADVEAGVEGEGEEPPEPDEKTKPLSSAESKGKDDGDLGSNDGKGKPEAKAEGDPKAEPKAEETKTQNYEEFYKQIMTPFKANGRNFEVKTPEEAIRLMQMGAGYGRKIQDLQPHLKTLRMLEKNNLLDEGKLSFLIDVNNKNPDAIKKVLKDSGIDPLDLDMESNVSYKPTNHAVSDQEVNFQAALKEVQENPTGSETVRIIAQTWDTVSKNILWESPQLLEVIQTQRELGVYDQIIAEIDRQKTLGSIPYNTPFLHAYKIAGDHLEASNALKVSQEQNPQVQQQGEIDPVVIATRSAAPKAQVTNGDKAAAASPTSGSSSRKASATINPLEMADDVFMKQFEGRF